MSQQPLLKKKKKYLSTYTCNKWFVFEIKYFHNKFIKVKFHFTSPSAVILDQQLLQKRLVNGSAMKRRFTALSSKKEGTHYISPKGDKYFMS